MPVYPAFFLAFSVNLLKKVQIHILFVFLFL